MWAKRRTTHAKNHKMLQAIEHLATHTGKVEKSIKLIANNKWTKPV